MVRLSSKKSVMSFDVGRTGIGYESDKERTLHNRNWFYFFCWPVRLSGPAIGWKVGLEPIVGMNRHHVHRDDDVDVERLSAGCALLKIIGQVRPLRC